MKRKLISVLLFVILLFLGFVYLNKVFSTENHFNNTINAFDKVSKEENIDILFFGSSHAFTAFNPLIIDKQLNTSSFNFGSDALRVPITDLVVNEVLKKTNPKLVVLEIYATSIKNPNTKENKGYQLRALDMVDNPFSKGKWEKAIRFYSKNELMGVYFPIFRNHHSWNKMNFFNTERLEDFNENTTFFYKGYIGSSLVINNKEKIKFENFKEKENYSENDRVFIDKQGEKDIETLINVSKSSGANVLVVSSPDLRAKSFWTNNFIKKLEKLCSMNEVKYLNLNDYYDAIKLEVTDFKDPSHLNINGAYKTSLFLAEFIKENYSFSEQSVPKSNKGEDSLYQSFLKKFIYVKEKTLDRAIKKPFTQDINLDSLSIQKNGSNLNFTLFINAIPKEIEKYKLLVKIIPTLEDLGSVNKLNISKGWNYDKLDVSFHNFNGRIDFRLSSAIEKIGKIELLLYNKDKYNGPVGNRIFINDINFN